MTTHAVIFGCAGTELQSGEAAFFRAANPWGFILFARNLDNPVQVIKLVNQLRECTGRIDTPVLIDQEGGRVARLKPPHWRITQPAAVFGQLFERNPGAAREACFISARLVADELSGLGINVDCVPVLDVPVAGSHQIIGDRAFSSRPDVVAELGRVTCEAMLAGGVLPVIKHIPGHGRAGADSHLALPQVSAALPALRHADFAPFKALADMPLAMTAHVAYSALDGDVPASHSAKIIKDIIREELGFGGVLMCDDLGMAALAGDFTERARKAIAAGCDVLLHCGGAMTEMQDVMRETPVLADKAALRCNAALARLRHASKFEVAWAIKRLAALLEPTAV